MRRHRIAAGVLSALLMWHAAPTAAATPVELPRQVLRIGPAAGTGTLTADYGIGATDLCEFMEFPSGILQVCGDSFAGQGVGYGGWYSPVALHVVGDSLDDGGGVRYDGVTRCWPTPPRRVPPSCPPVSSRSTARTTSWSPPPRPCGR